MPRQVRFSPAAIGTGDAQRLSSQSALFDQIGNTVTDFAVHAQREEARQLAQAHAGMMAESLADNSVRTKELKAEFELNPNQFDASHNAYAQGVASKLPPELREQYLVEADRSRRLARLDIDEAVSKDIEQKSKEQFSMGYDALLEQGIQLARLGSDELIDVREQILVGLAASPYTAGEQAAFIDKFDDAVDAEIILGGLEQSSDKAAYIENFAARKDMPIDKQQALIDQMQSIVKQDDAIEAAVNAEAIEADEQRRGLAASNLEIGVSRGTFGYDEIERAFQKGDITPAKRTQLIKEVDKQGADKVDDAVAMAQVSAALGGGLPLDPKDTNVKAAAEKMMSAVVGEPTQYTPEGRQIAAEMISRTGVIPENVERYLAVQINGPGAIEAADLMARINEKSPHVLSQIPQQDKSLGLLVARNTAQGMDPEVAVTAARETVFATPEEKQARKVAFAENFDAESALTDVIDDFDLPLFSFDPDPTPRMQASFRHLAEQHYMLTKDMEVAVNQAKKDIKRLWGVSEVNGSRSVTEFPPEAFYGVEGVDNDWMRNQLVAEFGDNAMIVPDGRTAREGDRPSYLVMKLDPELGATYDADRWRPDFSLTPESERLQAEAVELRKARMNEARVFRRLGAENAAERSRAERFGAPR